jgi:hypothetical protein
MVSLYWRPKFYIEIEVVMLAICLTLGILFRKSPRSLTAS